MKDLLTRMSGVGAIAVTLVVLLCITTALLSWLVTCGLVKVLTLCFGLTFTWGMATGVWIILMLAKWAYDHWFRK